MVQPECWYPTIKADDITYLRYPL